MNPTVHTETSNGTLIVTINRPEKLNALNREVILQLSEIMDEVYRNPEIRSVLITGAGSKAFVAGADISEFQHLSAAEGTALARRGHDMVFNKIEACPKPVVAAVNGFALGGGCELAMSCHFRIAAEQATFGQPEVNLGLIPGYGGTQRLVQLAGRGRAMEMMMTGRMVNAREAQQIGLVNEVTTSDALIGRALEILALIHTKAPLAISSIIKMVNIASYRPAEGLEAEVNAFGALLATEDAREGSAAFLEKRKPVFSGK